MIDLIGAKITRVRFMTKDELEAQGWDWEGSDSIHPIVALELDNGAVLYPSQDEEGNGGGALFGHKAGESDFYVWPRE